MVCTVDLQLACTRSLLICSILAHTKKADVARVEKCTYICTLKKEDAVPEPKAGAQSKLGNWKATAEADAELQKKFDGCMKGALPVRIWWEVN